MVAASRGGGVRAVAAVVTSGKELPGQFGGYAGVATPTGIKVLRRDELLVAKISVPRAVGDVFSGVALPVETGNLLIDELSGRVAIREALALRPDARVNHANDHSFAST